MSPTSFRPACLAAAFLAAAAPLAPAQAVARANVDGAGNQALHGASATPALSADGRCVAFVSSADNLVAGVSGFHCYVHDFGAETTEVVDVDSSGTLGNAGVQGDVVSITPDGRFVAFASGATNLVSGDTNGFTDVFVRDRVAGTTVRVSVDSTGAEGNWDSWYPSISADGSKVAFLSGATNFAAGVTLHFIEAYVHDLATGVTEIDSVDTSGNPSVYGLISLALSGDGNSVAFVTVASLAAGDTNGWYDAMVRDRTTGVTTLASVDSNGFDWGTNFDSPVSISADGRFVAFESYENLDVNLATNGVQSVFLRDMQAGTTVCVSVSSSGAAPDQECDQPAVSADGRFVAFTSWATNLGSDPSSSYANVFRRDVVNQRTDWCSANTSGAGADGDCGILDDNGDGWISISPDGRHVAYWSDADDLVANDTNGQNDLFAWGPALSLSAVPDVVKAGDTMTFDAWTGGAGALGMLAATNIDGTPTFVPVLVKTFDGGGVFGLSATVPSGLAGHQITFEAFGFLPSGRKAASNPKLVTFN
jgi:Tol biopolymer transport system component